MSWTTFTRRMRALVWRRRLEEDLDQELEFHRAMAAERGTPHRFGNEVRLREQAREAWIFTWLETLGQDLCFAIRGIRHAPGFAAAVVLVLALGIGANGAIFSLACAVLWQPLPYPGAGRVVVLGQHNPKYPRATADSSLDVSVARKEVPGLRNWSLYRLDLAALTGAGDAAMLEGVEIEASAFAALGAKPVAERLLLPSDDRPGAAPAVMVSARLWRERWHQNPAVIGKTIDLSGKSYTLVGVLPDWFRFPTAMGLPMAHWSTSYWRAWQEAPESAGNRDARTVAQLVPGVSQAKVERRLEAVMQQLGSKYSQDKGWRFELTPLREAIAGNVASALWVMLAVVGLVLLLAAANVACLLSARTQRRRHELATRAALGASRRRLARQLWTETAVLIALGAGVGLVLAAAGIAWLRAAVPADMPRLAQVGMNWPVVGCAAAAAALVMLVFGLPPAWLATGQRLEESLRPARRLVAGGRGRSAWVVAQVAISLLLLVSAGLLLAAWARMRGVRLGFNPDHVLTFHLMLPEAQYATRAVRLGFLKRAEAQMSALPGVQTAAMVMALPLQGNVITSYSLPGKKLGPGDTRQRIGYDEIGGHYLATMQIPVIRGRGIRTTDTPSAPPVAVINQAAADTIFAGRDPVGQRIRFSFGPQPWRTIVGVVGNVRPELGSAPSVAPAMAYVPMEQRSWISGGFVLRTRAAPMAVLPEVRRAMAALDGQIPVAMPETLDSVYAQLLAEPRFRGWLVGGFGLLALLLTAAGIFGALGYSVGGRTQEMGVRAALGARPGQVLWMVLREALAMVAIGLVVGVTLALVLTRYLQALLYGVSPTDARIWCGVSGLMLAVALAAAWGPARRAMRVDPARALRCE